MIRGKHGFHCDLARDEPRTSVFVRLVPRDERSYPCRWVFAICICTRRGRGGGRAEYINADVDDTWKCLHLAGRAIRYHSQVDGVSDVWAVAVVFVDKTEPVLVICFPFIG